MKEEIDMLDVRVDSQLTAPNILMRLTHLKTGKMVAGIGQSHYRLKNELIERLTEKVNNA